MNAFFRSPRPLWFLAWILAALSSARAAPVAPDLARRVAAAWSSENAALAPDFGEALDAVPVTDADGQLLWYEVPTAGGGCLVVAPDTGLEPVVAAIPDYEGGIPEGHPLRALLEADMRQRLSVLDATPVRRAAARSAPTAVSSAASSGIAAAKTLAERKWARLADDASLAPAEEGDDRDDPLVFAASSASARPARVYSFLDEWKRPKLTHWNQNGWNTFGSWDSVYDLYTPNHYPCGCVATAGAALLQFFNVTTAPTLSNVCYVDGAKRTLTTKGGTYDWSKLPATWSRNQALTDEQKDILGRATYDMGVCLGMSYESDGSGASISTLATVLREKYGFADARYVYSIGAGHYEKLVYAQLRCGFPVVLSIRGSGGHAVLAVGYGEDGDAAAYTRVFMGWGGRADAWYALPNVEDYTTLDGIVTMIGTTTATVPVCGRVTDESGTGDGFASVSRYTSSTSFTTVMANELGAWGTRVSPTLASAARKVACKGVTRTYSIGPSAATVQSYTASTLCAALPDVLTLTVPSERILPVQTTISDAREKAVAEGKLVFVFAGAQWCNYCAQLKKYLNSLGTDFTDRFVLCYLDMDEEQPAAMRVGSYPTYGLFDPRRLGEEGWTPENGLLAKDDGWNQARVDALLEDGWAAWTSVDRSPTGLVLALPSAIVSPTACSAEAVFADGETYPLSTGVSWSVTGTAATLSDGVLTPVSGMNGTVTVGATATLAGKTLSRTATVRVARPSDITGLVVSGPDVIDLYDVTGAQFTALAALSDGSFASIAAAWTVTESAVTNAVVSGGGYVDFPTPSKYTKASRLTVTAGFGSHAASASADVWGWSAKIASWTMPQRTLWPGQTARIVPQSIVWWRHGATEEPTTDLSGVEFGFYGYVRDTQWHYLSGGETASPDELALEIPSDLESDDGYGYLNLSVRATRHDATVSTSIQGYFGFLASAPPSMVSVTFDAAGGEPETQTSRYAVGYAYKYFPEVVRTGYSCGWYTAAEGGTRMTTASNCVASVTRLHARWSPNSYYVSYDSNGGTGSMGGHYFYYDRPASLRANAFTRPGYVFAGWATEPDGEVVFEDEAAILNLYDSYHFLKLYAKWVENGYRIVFDANGGVGTMPSQICRVGACSSLAPASFTRRGATFAGWSRTPDGAAEFSDRAEVCDLATTVGSTVTLYAVWNLPAVKTIELTGPDVIDLYDVESAQFSAVCRLANGTAADVAPKWAIEETAVTNAVVSTDGLIAFPDPAKYTKASKLRVTAECNGVRASRTVDVWGWSATLAAWTMPQRTLWPGQTVRVVPQSVVWWRHGATEEPTTDFSGVEFSFNGYVCGTQWHYLSGGETASPDELALEIPSDLESDDGYGYLNLSVRSTRHDATVSTSIQGYFGFLASAPPSMVSVTFDAAGGEPETQTSSYAAGYAYRYFPKVVRTGYSCDWYTAVEGGIRMTTASNCVASVTRLYARWSPNRYYVYYNANGGTGSMYGHYFYYDQPDSLRANAFTKAGAVFAGWATEPDGEVVFEDKAAILNLYDSYHSLALYAVWVENGYKIAFDANGGVGTMPSQICRVGTCSPLAPASFTRRGATFAGWSRTPDGAAEFSDRSEVCNLTTTVGSIVTLYAVWDLPAVKTIELAGPDAIDLYDVDSAQFTVICRLANGTAVDVAPKWTIEETAVTNAVLSADGLVTFPDPTKYTTASRLRVTAECNGVSASKEVDVWGWSVALSSWTTPQRVVWPGQTMEIVPATVRWWRHGVTEEPTTDFTGVDFSYGYGWVNGSTYIRGVSFADGDRLALNLPADLSEPHGRASMCVLTKAPRRNRSYEVYNWTYFNYLASAPAQTVAVTFDANGGEPASQTTKYAVGYTYGYFPTLSSRTGYYAADWYTAKEGGTRVTTASNCIASVTRLYARWSPRYYYISFDANGGSGYMGGNYFYYDQPDALRANAFTKTGHAFGGWATGPDGEVVFEDKATILNLASTYTNIILYAVWIPGAYTVTLDRQSGSGGSASVVATYGAAMPAIAVPTRTGYAFGGYWDKKNGGGTQYYKADGTSARSCNLAAATTLYAKWTACSYAVTLDPNGGTGGTASVAATYGSALPAVAVPRREGFFFGGYWTKPDGEGVLYYTGSGTSARNWDLASETTLYALWVESVPLAVHRFYSKAYKGHFFTIDDAEKQNLIDTNPNWRYEGVAYRAFEEEAAGTVALHRFYSKGYRGHFFTIDADEAETVKRNPNWRYEGVAYYVYPEESEGTVPVFRFWSKRYRHHFYTTDESEKDSLVATNPNWKYEGVAFYALPAPDANAEAPAAAPAGKGVQRAVRALAAAWTLAADGAAIAVPGVTEAGGAVVETRLDAPDADELGTWNLRAFEPSNPTSASLRLALPAGAFRATLWSAAEGTVADETAEGAFAFVLPADGVWRWLRVRDGEGEEPFSVWLRAE